MCAYAVVSVSLRVCLCVGVCVCDRVGVLCVWEGEEGEEGGSGGGGDGGWVGVVFVVRSAVSFRTVETEQLYQGKRMIGGIGHVLFSTYSQTDYGEDPPFGEPLEST